jgi:hypothetical protein
VLFLVFLVMVGLLTVAWGLGRTPAPRDGVPREPLESPAPTRRPSASAAPRGPSKPVASVAPTVLPEGPVFGDGRILVAVYGTAETGARDWHWGRD